jgi:hypothetical protein
VYLPLPPESNDRLLADEEQILEGFEATEEGFLPEISSVFEGVGVGGD